MELRTSKGSSQQMHKRVLHRRRRVFGVADTAKSVLRDPSCWYAAGGLEARGCASYAAQFASRVSAAAAG